MEDSWLLWVYFYNKIIQPNPLLGSFRKFSLRESISLAIVYSRLKLSPWKKLIQLHVIFTLTLFTFSVKHRYRKSKIDCLSLFMCPLLAQLKIGFFSSFSDAAVYSTNETNKACLKQSIIIFRCLWFLQQNYPEVSLLNKRHTLSSSFRCDQIYKYEIHDFGHTLLCYLSQT